MKTNDGFVSRSQTCDRKFFNGACAAGLRLSAAGYGFVMVKMRAAVQTLEPRELDTHDNTT
jgi:hypothetical protein